MDDSTARGRYRHHCSVKKGEGSAGGRKADRAGLAEDGELVCVGTECVDQFHGPLATCFVRSIAEAGNGECSRRSEECLEVERERDRHG